MKKKIQFFATAFIASALIFTACKKNAKDEVDYATELSAHSDDQNRFSNETDALANDDNTVLENYASFNGRVDNVTVLPCDASITSIDSTSSTKKITITFNGTACPGAARTRTGTVVLTMPLATRWKDAGAVLTDTIKNLKITRLSDGKSITINGTRTITNVNGSRLRDLVLGTTTTIIHTIASSNMSVTFDDGSVRTWQVARKRVFTGSGANIIITTTGNATVDGVANAAEWGTNRFGNAFVTAITQPLVVSGFCGFRLTSGQVTHNRLVATAVVTFGLDANGNAVTSCPTGPFYFKLVWTGITGVVRTVIAPY
jgi:outer membrane murein-binding lipoprotein Lpp